MKHRPLIVNSLKWMAKWLFCSILMMVLDEYTARQYPLFRYPRPRMIEFGLIEGFAIAFVWDIAVAIRRSSSGSEPFDD